MRRLQMAAFARGTGMGWNSRQPGPLPSEIHGGIFTMDNDRIEGATKEFAGKAESVVGDIAGEAKTQASGQAREAAGKVQNLYGQAKDVARDATEAAVDYAKGDGAEAVAKLVHQNPIGSLVAAGIAGFALALLISRPASRPQRRWRDY
jgi:uncharacterized protein YjbJ (UPF0337 family)